MFDFCFDEFVVKFYLYSVDGCISGYWKDIGGVYGVVIGVIVCLFDDYIGNYIVNGSFYIGGL